eukprot:CAMPEP_0114586664 /NCGR_PEP_ID=MMETSP0125-20121206/9818_1 /TAXON_ID=485358 ORGANISM="Aristerostoma sp., Strain ATCC 50986" /NCGR_SAMPLE_ID=MMETSP0125 /ASSEMBLY_ACC=CAM_ASM_000245 /LENGTH=67 /DNA_ID=CAMNT_0001782189 /DNA_START=733 /DNA_END=936 /DNA_ORIENTATION=+
MENDIKNLRNQVSDLQHQNQILNNENGKLSRFAKEKDYLENENEKLKEKVSDLLRENGQLNSRVVNA